MHLIYKYIIEKKQQYLTCFTNSQDRGELCVMVGIYYTLY